MYLYPYEHYEAHKLLAEENPDNYELVYAFYYMSHIKDVKDSNSYSEAKELFSKLQKERLSGRTLSEHHRANIKSGMAKYKGENNPAKRPEVRAKISEYKLKNPPMRNPEVAKKAAETRKNLLDV